MQQTAVKKLAADREAAKSCKVQLELWAGWLADRKRFRAHWAQTFGPWECTYHWRVNYGESTKNTAANGGRALATAAAAEAAETST